MKYDEMVEMAERFLAAWNTQDVEKVVATYTDDVYYTDPNTKGPVRGADNMRRYLKKLFAPWEMTWALREAHLFEDGNGCAVLWHATFKRQGGDKIIEADGMDLVIVEGGRIKRNEVYFDRAVLAPLM